MPERGWISALWCACALLGLAACDGEATQDDAGGGGACAVDADCADDVFCNGAEVCDPSSASADSRGCVAGDTAALCSSGQVCDPAMDACVDPDCVNPDADGDGEPSVACGGADCDDNDAARFPGNTEVCDAEGVDEDCDATTFGTTDLDRDGYIDARCCNGSTCGNDCDDTRPFVNPGSPEVCDALDNDCNPSTWAVGEDDDRDGYLNVVCGGDDCIDTNPDAYPGAPEPCNGVDNDCSGDVEDADGDGYVTPDAACTGGPYPKTDCDDTHAQVSPDHTDFEPLPYCPSAVPPCRVGGAGPYYCRASATAACSASDPLALYDWDCSGTAEAEPSVSLTCVYTCATTPTATFDDAEISPVCGGLGYNFVCNEGPSYGTTTPACGSDVNHEGCCCDSTGGCNDYLLEVTLPLRCR